MRFFVPILFLRGIGFGWSNLPLQTVAIGAITGRALPKANSLYNASAQIFSSIGVAVVTTILVQRTTLHASGIVQAAAASGARPPANLGLLAGTDAVSDVFKLLTFGTAFAVAVSFLLPRQSLKMRMASQSASTLATSDEQWEGAPSPAPPLATAQSSNGKSSDTPPMPIADTPAGMPESPLPVASAQRLGPPPGMPPGNMSAPDRTPDTAPVVASPPYVQNGHAPEYEERIASLERMVASLVEAVRNQPPVPVPSVDEGRLAALEQAVSNLDRTVHSMPPPVWHRTQYDRTGETEQRVVALERAVQHLTWSTAPSPSDSYRATTYSGVPRSGD